MLTSVFSDMILYPHYPAHSTTNIPTIHHNRI